MNLLKVPQSLTDDQVVLLSDVLPTAWCDLLLPPGSPALPGVICCSIWWPFPCFARKGLFLKV